METTGILLVAGFAAGYLLQYFTSKQRRLERTFALEREMMKNTIKSLHARLRTYEQPPKLEGNIGLGDLERTLGVKLPSWVKPIIQPYLEELQQHPEKLQEILSKIAKPKTEGQKELTIYGE